MLFLKRLSFNNSVLMVLALQYALMHLMSQDMADTITILELTVFITYSLVEIAVFIYRGRRTARGSISGTVPLSFAVLWIVAMCSHLQRETYPPLLPVITACGIFTACFILLFEYIVLIKD
ncbi:hypothetical protein C2I18_01145 [Paenibacillus sp. PK3_47]|uniref:hypothetical protein n=1 Tax=Paenibacillus sp. PK3_47 TaxID=2072642 RepID=UPI00201D3618|nr:hypothetical protein [Paenibacillus sp. PK3_47]UQZ32272.1 hypothetical protein C2I18_01145 [Paenibacillus sp. PK3_47]